MEMIEIEIEMIVDMLIEVMCEVIMVATTAQYWGYRQPDQGKTWKQLQQQQQHQDLPNLKATDSLAKEKHENSKGAPLGLGKGGAVWF